MLERLHKVLARAGVAALRPAEDMIMEGRVTVNGRVVRELGARVDPDSDVIAVDGELVEPIRPSDPHRYVAVYKPIGVVSTARDTHDRPTVIGLVPSDARLFPVGRLDLESEGLLLLTDDGALAYRLTHPRFEVEKEYRVLLDRAPSIEDLRRWRDGIELDGEMTMPAWVEVQDRATNGVWVRIVMREGRKRQIREIAKLLGYEVRRLIRVREGTLHLGELAPGQWRELAPDEVEALRAHVRHVPGPPADEQESRVPISSDDDRETQGADRRPRRISPRPGFGSRGPGAGRARRAEAYSDEGESRPERQPAPQRSDERAAAPAPQRQGDEQQRRAPRNDAAQPQRSSGRGDEQRRDDRGARTTRSRDEGQRGSYERRDEGQRGSYERRDEGQRAPYGNRDDRRRSSGPNQRRDDTRRGPNQRRDDNQRAPYGNRDDRQPRAYGNRGSGTQGTRSPAGGRSRSSLDPRSGRSSEGGRSRSSLDPRAGRASEGGRSRSSLDPRAGRASEGGRSRSSLDPRSRSEGRDRAPYSRGGPGARSSGPSGSRSSGGIRGNAPSRGNSRGAPRPGQRDDRYGGSSRDNRYGSRSSSGGSRSGQRSSATGRPSYDPNRRTDYDPNRRPDRDPNRRPDSDPNRRSSPPRASTAQRRSPGPRPRPNRRPPEENDES